MIGIVALVLRFDNRCRTTESALSVALFEPIRADRDARVAGSSGETLHAFVTIEPPSFAAARSEEHTSELQSHLNLVCRLLLEKKKRRGRDYSRSEVVSARV